ncbi:MAG: pitrilysin family protein [Peptostreptococcaceae bacterium]|nr:pitrilysin family protein [Peptostreptococcaceae bacterium]
MENKKSLFGEELYFDKLDNNLEVFYMPKKGFTKKYAILATNYGSNDLKFISSRTGKLVELNHGIAHFLEHKMFEQPDGSDAFGEFSKYGANANAYTNFNMTAYLFSTTDNFYPALEHLLSYVSRPHFTDENVKKEQGIIAQEIKMYEDNSDWRSFFNTLRAMYIDHPNHIDIAGTVESIHRITKEELYECYKTFYSPSNMALFVIGDLDWDEILSSVKKIDMPDYMEGKEIERIFVDEPDRIAQKEIVNQMDVSIPMFSIGYKDRWNGRIEGEELLKKSLETEMIFGSLFRKGSDLNEYLYDNQLILEPLSCDYNSHNDYGYSIISGESRDIDTACAKIKECIAHHREYGIDPAVFERVKKAKLGAFVRGFDSIEGIANSFLNYYFEGINFFDVYDGMRSVTLEDVNRRLREHFDEEMSVLSVIQPIESR